MTAILFQNMPPLSPEEYAALEASIREHGVQVPILLDENNVVIDGHHRQKIATELGVPCPKRHVFDLTGLEKRTLALTLNLDRRHLNREQRRALIAASVKADPQLSDLQHAKRTGASDKTVATVRREMESRSEIPNVETRTDSLGRQQPVIKPDPLAEEKADGRVVKLTGPGPLLQSETTERIDPAIGEVIPASTPTQPRRRPLPDQFFDAAYDVNRRIESLHRLTTDDRFPQNANKVAQKHLRDLIASRDLLQQVINQLS